MTRNADSIGTRTCRPARSQEYHGPRVVLVVVLAMVGGRPARTTTAPLKRCGGAWWWRWCADSARWASSGRHVDHRDRRRVMISM